jgi:REP element-mobilizing transposase RayT
MKEYHGCAEVRRPSKKYLVFFNGEVFFLLTSPLMGAPTLSDIICSFKSRSSLECIRYIKRNNLNLSGKIWQRSFYDHVIRNERSLNEIREYILANPVNRELDIENIMNL